MKKTHILFISLDGLTDPLGQAQILPYLFGLSSKGYFIEILSAEKPIQLENHGANILNQCESKGIRWHKVKYSSSPPILGSFITFFRLRQAGKKLFCTERFDLVHARSYLPAIIGLDLKRTFGSKLLFDMRGLWANEKIDGKIWNLSNPVFQILYRYLKYKERILLNHSDAIVSLTNKVLPYLKSLIKSTPTTNTLSVIPCCTDLSLFDYNRTTEARSTQIRQELNINPRDFILCYAGSLSTWYLPYEMMQFFKRLYLFIPNARFLILTKEKPDFVQNMAEQAGIPTDKVVIRQVNRHEVPELLSVSNLGICFIKPAFSKLASSPVKIGEMLGSGLPVICNTGIGDTDWQITSTEAGVICKGFNEQDFDLTIQNSLTLLDRKSKKHFRDCAKKLFDLEIGIAAYDRLYRLLKEKKINDDKAHSSGSSLPDKPAPGRPPSPFGG